MVAPNANKVQIKQAIEEIFNVKVTNVNTLNRAGKRQRTRNGFGPVSYTHLCEHVTNYLAGQKTVGIIREDDVMGIDEIAEPVGVVAGVTPVTNPTLSLIHISYRHHRDIVLPHR